MVCFLHSIVEPEQGNDRLTEHWSDDFYIEELDLKTEKEIRGLLDESTISDMPMTKFD